MSGGTSSGKRGRWLIVALVLATCGALGGAWAGRQVVPEEPAVAVSLAVAGFGLGGLVGMLGLGLRALLLRAMRLPGRWRPRTAPPSHAATDTAQADASASTPAPDPAPEPTADPQPEPATPLGPSVAAEPGPEPEPVPEPPAGEEPGWYPDPHQPGRNRYWDGRSWTAHVSRDREERTRRRSRARRTSR